MIHQDFGVRQTQVDHLTMSTSKEVMVTAWIPVKEVIPTLKQQLVISINIFQVLNRIPNYKHFSQH